MSFPHPIAPFSNLGATNSGTLNASNVAATTANFNKTGPLTLAAVTGAGGATCINVAFTPNGVATADLGVCVPVNASPITVQVNYAAAYDIEISTDAGTAVLHWFAAG